MSDQPFADELWDFLAKSPPVFPITIVGEVYDLKKKSFREALTRNALRIATILKKKLPDHLHNRMVLGETDQYTSEYIDLLNRLKDQ